MNKIDEMCYRVALTNEFQLDATPLRASFSIPADGFKDEKAYTAWYAQNTLDRHNEFHIRCADLVTKYRLPPDANIRLKEYVLFGASGMRPESLDVWVPMDELAVCDIELSRKSAEQWEHSDIPFVRVIISDHANQNDAVKYVRSHWNIIQKLLDAQRSGKKKHLVRAIHDRALQEAILKLNRLPTKELRKQAKKTLPEGAFTYKETAIREILAADGKRVSEEMIKKVVSRRSKRRDTER